MSAGADRLGLEYCGAVLSGDKTHVQALRASAPTGELLDGIDTAMVLLCSHLASQSGHKVDELGRDLMMVAAAESDPSPD